LVVGAVKAHLELRGVCRVFFDVVHRFEVVFCVVVARGLVDLGEGVDGAVRVVEFFVMPFHVGGVGVGYGDVVREFGGAENSALADGGGSGKETFGCVSAGERQL
jgi:hypothetical protein